MSYVQINTYMKIHNELFQLRRTGAPTQPADFQSARVEEPDLFSRACDTRSKPLFIGELSVALCSVHFKAFYIINFK
ncbi:hypothetical protein CEQ90_20200 [Lewinellaceae bacterium SD302]|nr:hypothetical protein CEQ90_20200 [Lewinellaceae bacterium SD302]